MQQQLKEKDQAINIKHDGHIAIAIGKSKKETHWKNKNMLYSALVEKLSNTTRTPETYAEFKKMPKTERDRIKDVGGFVGGSLKNGRRKAENVANRTLLTLDLDYVNGDIWSSVELLYDFACVMYSTHTHAPDNQRLRLVIPLSRPVLPDEYQAISRMVADDLGIDQFDDTTYEPCRLMYWPSTSSNGEYIFRVQDEPWLNPDDVLARYTFGWKDVSYWPESSRARAKLNSALKKQEDPLEKKGIIGAFCRTYSITEAIAEFLNDVYIPGADETRYTYAEGSTTGGIVVYEDKFSYSHHGTDPASGILCNAFDSVRIHKFGHLDEDAKEDTKEDTPANKLPSFIAMKEFAKADKKTNSEYMREEFSNGEEELDIEEKIEIAKNYLIMTEKGFKVNTGLLAKYIRENSNYMIVRKQGYDNDLLYWYEKGVYRRISANELKGRIKSYIPEKIRKPSQWEDTYKELITDTTSINYEDLDTNEEYINVKNGLYNIKTKELEVHSPDIKSTIQLNCNYNPYASEPKEWLKFINTLCNGDGDLAAILQEWFGLVISNITAGRLKKCLALYGKIGDTGKTQYNNMLIYLLGNYNICSIPIQDLGKNFALGDLYGKRALIVDDQTSINMEDSSNFKALTGGGVVRCEMKGKQAFPYVYRGTITFGCNDLPYIKDDKGDHVFGRLIIIPCDNVIPYDKRDVNIIQLFKSEADGIFLWALEGLNRLIANKYKFTNSKASNKALEDYRQLNDSLYRFIKEKYIITKDKKDKIKKTEFEYDYSLWASQEEIHAVEKKNIKARLEKHGILCSVRDGYECYVGLISEKSGFK